jgi:hypothetical protein
MRVIGEFTKNILNSNEEDKIINGTWITYSITAAVGTKINLFKGLSQKDPE